MSKEKADQITKIITNSIPAAKEFLDSLEDQIWVVEPGFEHNVQTHAEIERLGAEAIVDAMVNRYLETAVKHQFTSNELVSAMRTQYFTWRKSIYG
jgi:hypothetical protein